MKQIYRTLHHPDGISVLPIYEINNNEIFRTINHQKGQSILPDYEIKGNEIYRSITHPDGWSGLAEYEIKGNEIYRSITHPNGWSGLAEYEIKDIATMKTNITYWHMQLHPNTQGWGKEIELLESKNLIGLGKSKSEIAYINFKDDMDIGDIVLIKRGGLVLALVEVVGSCEDAQTNFDDRLDWFRYRRKIKILATNTNKMEPFPQPRKTLQKATNKYTLSYKYIDNWYKSYNAKSKKEMGLKLHSLKIDDFKLFKDFEIDFLDEEGKPLSIVVIIGKNGTGKTTLLEYIKRDNFLTIGANYQENTNYIQLIENGKSKKLNNEAKSKQEEIDNQLKIKAEQNGLAGVVYSEGDLYMGNLEKDIIYEPAVTPTKEDIETLDKLILEYIDYFIYEKNISASTSYENLQNDIDEIFDGFELNFTFNKVDAKNKTALFSSTDLSKEKESFGLQSLSTGEKTLIFKILKLYLQEVKNKVILIDEPELSLHPSWQNKIISIYEKFAKINNNQIIIATHSPHILSSVENKSIRVLAKDEYGKIKAIKNNLFAKGRDMNSILFDIMGEVSYRPKKFIDMIDAMYEFIDENRYQEALEVFTKLQKNYGDNDTVIIEAKMALEMMESKA